MSDYADYKQAKTSDSDCSSALQFSSYRQRLVSADSNLVDAARDLIYIASQRKLHGCSQVRKPVLNLHDLSISDITGIELDSSSSLHALHV